MAAGGRTRHRPGSLSSGSKSRVEILGQRAHERGVAALAAAARQARQGHQQVGELLAFRRDAEDVQSVADLQLLQFAQVVVELAERRIGIVAAGHAAVLVEAGRGRQFEDAVAQQAAAARIEAGSFVIFVDQLLEIAQRP